MGHGVLKGATGGGEDDAIGAGRAAGVDLVGFQDGELVIGPVVRQVEAFVVVKAVRVAARARPPPQVRTPRRHRRVDVALPVTNRSADFDAGLALIAGGKW